MHDLEFETLSWPEKGSTVAVGMSGGVDSTLTAVLLKEHGCKVIGVTMSTWKDDLPLPPSPEKRRSSCYGPDEQIDIHQCADFCKKNAIEYHVIDVSLAYHTEVLEYFKSEYRSGRTPNPCVHCNRKVKFGALLDGVKALGINFDYFCTGHYANLVRPVQSIEKLYAKDVPETSVQKQKYIKHPVMIAGAKDAAKDQAYFLHRIFSDVLEKVRFPLGCMKKTESLALAREKGLAAAARKESQDFVPPEYFDIIFSDKTSNSGDIVNLAGETLGMHRGIEHYTVGQRRGLGVSANQALYVHSIDSKQNKIILAEDEDLLSNGLLADNWVWAGNYAPKTEFKAMVKIRLASAPVPACIIPFDSKTYSIFFEKPQRAVAPGQSAVVYLDGIITGGGIISRSL